MKCHICGNELRINKKWILFKKYVLNKDNITVRCNQCQSVHSLYINTHIVKDNVQFGKNNKVKANYYKEVK